MAALAAGASIACLGIALQPPAESTRPVVVAAADLRAGRPLQPEDLAVARVPSGVLPAGTRAEPSGLVGRVLAAPVARGEVVAEHRLTGLPPWAVPPGTLPVPVRFADSGAAALLSPGQRVDVVAASGRSIEGTAPFATAELVAQDILILAVMTGEDGSDGLLGASPTTDEQTPLVLLAADQSAALAIAGAQSRASLSFLMRLGPD